MCTDITKTKIEANKKSGEANIEKLSFAQYVYDILEERGFKKNVKKNGLLSFKSNDNKTVIIIEGETLDSNNLKKDKLNSDVDILGTPGSITSGLRNNSRVYETSLKPIIGNFEGYSFNIQQEVIRMSSQFYISNNTSNVDTADITKVELFFNLMPTEDTNDYRDGIIEVKNLDGSFMPSLEARFEHIGSSQKILDYNLICMK